VRNARGRQQHIEPAMATDSFRDEAAAIDFLAGVSAKKRCLGPARA
jgi:hypothetical protein